MKVFLKKINFLLSKQDKYKLFILLIMTLILSFIEMVGIGAIMPFISTASNPSLIYSNKYYYYFYTLLNLSNSQEFIFYFGISLVIFYIFRALFVIYYNYILSKFSMKKYNFIANKLFEKYIKMPYVLFAQKNSSTISKLIVVEALHLSYLLQHTLLLLSEIIVVIIIYLLLLLVDLKITLILTIFMGMKVLLLTKTVSKKIKSLGKKRAFLQERIQRVINEVVGNFKIIKFISNEYSLIKRFSTISKEFTKIQTFNTTLSSVPRNLLEAVGFSVLIIIVVYLVIYKNDVTSVIPIITMYALALYRLLPATTKIMYSYNNIIYFAPSLDMIYKNLTIDYPEENSKKISFNKIIELKNIKYTFDEKNIIFSNLNLTIKKGQKVAFIGESGSGKSTLVDIICGIYKPSSGKIFIDNIELENSNIISWRKKIGYIPQSIYLFDGTIAQNITFGREYNKDKVIAVLKQANIYELIMQKNGLDTTVGEGGIQLSGGQKQRIGIARALYGDPDILVLDEATSALDTTTEQAIMEEIYKVSKEKTLIVIAHRLSTIEQCDIKINVEELSLK